MHLPFLRRPALASMGTFSAQDAPKRFPLAAFLRHRAGTTAIEFAIVIMPLLGFVFLIFAVAVYHFTVQSLDFATRRAARQIMLGTVPAGAQTAAGFRNTILCPKILLAFSCDLLTVNAYKVEGTSDAAAGTGIYQFVNTATTSLNASKAGGSFCLGGPSDFVFLDVTYTFPNILGALLSGGTKAPEGFPVRSTAFFRNEPFPTPGPTC